MFNIIIILAATIQALVGLFVYLKKRDSLTNIAFALLSFASLAWAITNFAYTLNAVSPSALYITRLVLFWVVIQNAAFFIFANQYPSSTAVVSKKRLWLVLIFGLLAGAATLSPYVFISVSIKDHQAFPNPGPAIIIFILYSIYTIGLGLTSLIKKRIKASGRQKIHLNYILFASFLSFLLVPITNFVITQAFKTSYFAKISPIYTLLFASIIGYAIVAQKLFDIKAAVTRSVGYVLVLGSVALIYGAVFYVVDNIFFKNIGYETQKEIFSIVLVAILALSFQTLKQFFDKLTNRIFYRDDYDIQEVMDELGDVAVAEIDLQKILNSTKKVLSSALKTKFIEFVLIKGDKPFLEPLNRWKAKLDAAQISKHILSQHHELIIVEELAEDNYLKNALLQSDVGASLRLKTQDQVVGFILLGEKNSGDIFSSKDKDLLLIVANELSVTIQNALRFEEIQNFNLTLQYKVENATYQLRKANNRLKELDDAKDDFISMASHQLRTPLSLIEGYLKMVMIGDAGKINDRQNRFLAQAQENTTRMVDLVSELLSVSRITSGKFTIEAGPVNLATLIDKEVKQLMSMAESHKIALTFHKPEHFPLLMLDEDKTKQVIINFIDNAIYYSKPKGAKIDVQLTVNEDLIEFRVVDNGIGVPEKEKEKLFTKFYRAENAKDARPDGTGVGLYLAKVVITEEGGNLIFDSKEGAGSTFGFSFKKDKIVTGANHDK
ncbi:MAG TPA: ATP-binding protein [Candidatus Binatia bacterium]|nr:ATP-binding protein [Candidatus Binatia bacterium]